MSPYIDGTMPEGMVWAVIPGLGLRLMSFLAFDLLKKECPRVRLPRKPGPERGKIHYARPFQCTRGHSFDGANTYVNKLGHWACRKCRAEAMRQYRMRIAGRRNG